MYMPSLFSCVQLFVTPWTVAQQDPLSLEFSRQEYWRGLPFPSPGDPPYPGINPMSPAWQVALSHLGSQVYIYSGILFSLKKEGNPALF